MEWTKMERAEKVGGEDRTCLIRRCISLHGRHVCAWVRVLLLPKCICPPRRHAYAWVAVQKRGCAYKRMRRRWTDERERRKSWRGGKGYLSCRNAYLLTPRHEYAWGWSKAPIKRRRGVDQMEGKGGEDRTCPIPASHFVYCPL